MADETYLQYLARMNDGRLPSGAVANLLFAGARNETARDLGMSPLSHDQQYKASKQGLGPAYMGKVKWGNGKWVNLGDGADYKGPGNTFNYSQLHAYPTQQGRGKSYEDGMPDGDQAGMGRPVIQPPPQQPPPGPPQTGGDRIPRSPPAGGGQFDSYGNRFPPAQPPAQPPVVPPSMGGGRLPPQQPGVATSPMKSFNPTQLLLALRAASMYGQNRGANAVQQPGALSSWLASAMQNGQSGNVRPGSVG